MKGKIILITSMLIAILAITASGAGLLWKDLYKNDTKSGAAQMVGNDLVTLVLGVPLLLISAYFAAKGLLRGKLIWIGTVFYFLYVYASMSFLATYNQFFLIYVAIFSLSLYTLSASLLTLNVRQIKENFSDAPVKATAYFMFFFGIMVSLMWLSIIIPSAITGERPAMLETYTTLVIQALDLGIVAPLGFITGMLLLKRDAWGYALASIVLIKCVTLGTAVLSMALIMMLDGIEVTIPQLILFAVLTLGALAFAIMLYSKMKAPGKTDMTITG